MMMTSFSIGNLYMYAALILGGCQKVTGKDVYLHQLLIPKRLKSLADKFVFMSFILNKAKYFSSLLYKEKIN